MPTAGIGGYPFRSAWFLKPRRRGSGISSFIANLGWSDADTTDGDIKAQFFFAANSSGPLICAPGLMEWNGINVPISAKRNIINALATVIFSGQNANIYTLLGLLGLGGQIEFQGGAVGLARGLLTASQTASLEFSGQSSVFIRGLVRSNIGGSISLSTPDVGLIVGRLGMQLPGEFEVLASDASICAARMLWTVHSEIAMAGQEALLILSGLLSLLADVANISFVGGEVTLTVTRIPARRKRSIIVVSSPTKQNKKQRKRQRREEIESKAPQFDYARQFDRLKQDQEAAAQVLIDAVNDLQTREAMQELTQQLNHEIKQRERENELDDEEIFYLLESVGI